MSDSVKSYILELCLRFRQLQNRIDSLCRDYRLKAPRPPRRLRRLWLLERSDHNPTGLATLEIHFIRLYPFQMRLVGAHDTEPLLLHESDVEMLWRRLEPQSLTQFVRWLVRVIAWLEIVEGKLLVLSHERIERVYGSERRLFARLRAWWRRLIGVLFRYLSHKI